MAKNVGDARYQKTEQAILYALTKILSTKPHTFNLRPTDLARKSGITLSTFYRHYKNINEILDRQERRIMKRYRILINRLRPKHLTLKQTFRHVLIFIISHQEFFSLALSHHNRRLIYLMFCEIKPEICTNCHFPKNCTKMFNICFNEFYGLLEKWHQNHLPVSELEQVLTDIVYLIESSRTRLLKIN